MATTAITSIDTSISKLANTFQLAIKATIESESEPLKKVQAQKDAIDVKRAVYTDVKANVDGLQSAVQALISSQASFGMTMVAKATITPGTAGSTVLSATTSDNTTVADYDIAVTRLAKAQSRSTTVAYSADVALGKSGTFWLGGSGTAVLQTKISSSPDVYSDFVPSTSVTSAATTTVASGQRELGTGDYTLETRDSDGTRQFRLVDADGNAVSIRSQAGTSYTSAWQTMTDGNYDTGRGLNLTLSVSGGSTSTILTYTAAGTSINITATDSLRNITNAINAASQPEGRDLKASIVANKLVLTGAQTGENHTMLYTDGAGLGFGADLQTAQNALFSVNGMSVSRSTNTNLSDVVSGAVINLASDAEGKTARLSIAATSDKALGLMNTLVNKFNATFTHLTQKLAITSKTDGGKTTYTRGALTGDTTFSSLRNDLSYRMNRSYTNSGSFKRLEEIGLSFDKDMKLTFDSTKFSAALTNHATDLTAVLDAGLGDVNSLLARYSGTTGVMSKTLNSVDVQRAIYDKRITKYNDTLAARKQALFDTYLGYQNTLVDLGYQSQMIGLLTGTSNSFNTGTTVNTSG